MFTRHVGPNRSLVIRTALAVCLSAVACTSAEPESHGGSEDSEPTTAEPTGTTQSSEAACEPGLEVGNCPPEFALPDTTDQLVALSEFQGQVVLIASEALW